MSARVWLLLLAVAAIAFGCYARFKGIATWPVAVDEYYILRSVQNVLSSGLPRYDCGGLYTRGIVFQYITAGLQLGGATPELAGRLVAAVASLITLPAAYLIGRRLHGHALGLLVAVLLALSVWEVEIARFARMYAPFQAVFTWYVVCFLRYYVDGERRALWGMLILSVLGALIWEGGLFLAALNLLPPFLRTPSGRLTRGDWARVAGMLLLLVPIGWFVMANLRASGTGAELPVGFCARPPRVRWARDNGALANDHELPAMARGGVGAVGRGALLDSLDVALAGSLARGSRPWRRAGARSRSPVRRLRPRSGSPAGNRSDAVAGVS